MAQSMIPEQDSVMHCLGLEGLAPTPMTEMLWTAGQLMEFAHEEEIVPLVITFMTTAQEIGLPRRLGPNNCHGRLPGSTGYQQQQ